MRGRKPAGRLCTDEMAMECSWYQATGARSPELFATAEGRHHHGKTESLDVRMKYASFLISRAIDRENAKKAEAIRGALGR